MKDDTTEGVAEHISRLQPSINLHAPVTTFMFSCSVMCIGQGLELALVLPVPINNHYVYIYSFYCAIDIVDEVLNK